MDSFYDVPRCVPAPTRVEKMNIRPTVPEVSLLCQSKPTHNNDGMNGQVWPKRSSRSETSYLNIHSKENTLKELHNNYSNIHQNSPLVSSSFSRKQVRFESPVLQQRPSLTYEPFLPRKVEKVGRPEPVTLKNDHDYKMTVAKNRGNHQKHTFQEIYMANIPNRHLDLSIVDIPKINVGETSTQLSEMEDMQKNKENELPKTYKEFLETQKKISKAQKRDQAITDILNYKRCNLGISNETPPRFSNSYRHDDEINNSNPFRVSSKYTPDSNQNEKLTSPFIPPGTTNSANILNEEKFSKISHDIDKENHHYCDSSNDRYTCKDKYIPKHNERSHIDEPYTAKQCNDFEPSNRDLLKIIAQQNEQLLLLQKQVAVLLNRDHNYQNKPIEAAPKMNDEQLSIDREPLRFIPEINLTPKKHGLSKFSVDVMTSFEVAIRPQHNRQAQLNCNSSKIQEITEEESTVSSTTDANKRTLEHSLHLQEPVNVVEPCPSPEPSININMNDYDSSDDEESATEIGATFYHNLMGQVNNILKQAQLQTRDDLCSKGIDVNKKITCSKANITMHRVREATLKHLRDIGVTIGPMDEDNICASAESDNREFSPTEISYGVKQLLMKYLPDEHLAKISTKPKLKSDRHKRDMHGLMEGKHDLSFASLQYMQKYNLLPPSEIPKQKEKMISNKPTIENYRKILDLTALKLQPKLLDHPNMFKYDK